MAGSIIDIHERKILETQHLQAEFLLEETSRIALLGGWSYDLNTEELRWSREVFQIYDLPADYQPTLRDGLKFYPKEARKKVAFAMKEAISHAKPWDLELPFVSAKGRKLWVRAKGEPVLDQDGKCTQLRGIFQDITEKKEKEIEQQKTKELLISQNDQLSSFAHIVSHNLRKHSGNLEMMTSMYQEAEEEEKPLFFEKIEAVSTSFSDTIDQLAEVVKISVDINKKRKPVFFDKVLKKTYTILEGEITKIEAEISADFKEIGGLAYPPAYMESIFLNLLSNSIRYRHPDRKPIILFRSFKEDGKVKLSCTDNGLGIDLNMHSGKVFGMYKTFHKNEDARGVGLFLIHNQVTALGGGINVESEVGKWTTFTITF